MNDIGSHDRSTFPYHFLKKSFFKQKGLRLFRSPMKSKGCGVSPAALVFFMGFFALTSMPSYQDNEPPGCCRGGALRCISKMCYFNWVNHFSLQINF
jgi:hypothetical protein